MSKSFDLKKLSVNKAVKPVKDLESKAVAQIHSTPSVLQPQKEDVVRISLDTPKSLYKILKGLAVDDSVSLKEYILTVMEKHVKELSK
jgi:hypothetical protein